MKKYDELENQIEGNLYELFAKDFSTAREGEIFASLANSIRRFIGKKWFETYRDNIKNKVIYILSYEYTIGDQLLKNLIKLDFLEETKEVLKSKNIDFDEIREKDIEFALGFGDMGDSTQKFVELLTAKKENVYAYGLRYRRGMLKQEIVQGEQIEKPDDWQINKNPWEHEKGFSHFVNFKDFSVKAIPYDIPILSNDGEYVNTLRLWKSFSINDLDFQMFSNGQILDSYDEINRANSIVEFLYPSENNKEGLKLRLMQEYFFASSSMQDIFKKFKKYQGNNILEMDKHIKIQIHDVHPVLAMLVFIDLAMGKYELSFEESLNIAKKVFVFLHASLLPESFQAWDINLIGEVCPNILDIIFKLDKHIKAEFLSSERDFDYPLLIIKDGYVDLLNIAYYISNSVITVSDSHIDLIKHKYMKDHYKRYNYKMYNLNVPFDGKQYIKEIYPEYKYNPESNGYVDFDFYKKVKMEKKIKMLDHLNIDKNLINMNSAFVSHLGVFHEYKRQMLSVLGVALQYFRLKRNPNLDLPERTYLFGGKTYPNYYIAKETIKFINELANQINNDLFIKDKIKIVFIENYNLTKSNIVIPATDIYQKLGIFSMQSDDYGLDRAILNGSAIVSTNSYFDDNILNKNDVKSYTFGDSKDDMIFSNNYNLYEFLENNPEIEDLFNFYRSLPMSTFPYDIDKIYNSIYYFNDENHIIKDLYEYTDTLEKAIKDYSDEKLWYNNCLYNAEKVLSLNDKNYLEKYIEIMEK
ncbi:glycogen/starch/alpha-glucan phosphorylase [Helcococcus kunzii]|uniref:glycogen/starch/alpha-glucan phosphorylase n=1 Tax=Helcococcus kunzii TaxID=40091 RepID=UPI001BAF4B45|nr:glycogen/starch/alpha-glucan phosphorylase [Helcococcus kunzii]MCT1795400.1 glycogen/starch/alpha-glucan phosphorylase [Helcococcus kunzii]MCT1989649.1 glycogen/starch/alpha-glucan phosphorylase [Helcococcus kunzii]QUY64655.1 glycogen/starch/alpha-glucan phosphorylase [Helcococcus kunzii]